MEKNKMDILMQDFDTNKTIVEFIDAEGKVLNHFVKGKPSTSPICIYKKEDLRGGARFYNINDKLFVIATWDPTPKRDMQNGWKSWGFFWIPNADEIPIVIDENYPQYFDYLHITKIEDMKEKCWQLIDTESRVPLKEDEIKEIVGYLADLLERKIKSLASNLGCNHFNANDPDFLFNEYWLDIESDKQIEWKHPAQPFANPLDALRYLRFISGCNY